MLAASVQRKYAYGDLYIGQTLGFRRHGKGKLLGYANKGDLAECYYEGDFVNDRIEGHGELQYSDGGKYVGQFKDSKKHGKGKMVHKPKSED